VILSASGSSPVTVDAVTVEMIDSMAPGRPTVAQADALCPATGGATAVASGEVSRSSPLVITGPVTCTFIMKAPPTPGVALTATVSLADSGSSVSSSIYGISQFREAGAASGCALLMSGVAATNLAAAGNGRLAAVPEGVVAPEVCEAGSKQVRFRVGPPPPGTPCGDYTVRLHPVQLPDCCAAFCSVCTPPGRSTGQTCVGRLDLAASLHSCI